MPSIVVARREIGQTSPVRETLGATVLLAGAAALAVCAGVLKFNFYEDLTVLGAAATFAWLVDGTAERYIGAGTGALAIGGGLTLGARFHVRDYEQLVVFGFVGLALLLVSYVNPKAVRGSAALFGLIAITVAILEYLRSYNVGWEMTGILALWSVFEYGRIARSRRVVREAPDGLAGDRDPLKVSAPGQAPATRTGQAGA